MVLLAFARRRCAVTMRNKMDMLLGTYVFLLKAYVRASQQWGEGERGGGGGGRGEKSKSHYVCAQCKHFVFLKW